MHPILYEMAGAQIGTYGVCIVLGGAAAWMLARVLVCRNGGRLFAFDDMTYASLMCIAGGFTGAFLFRPVTRIPELIFRWNEFKGLPAGVILGSMFGEIVFYGGLIGGAAALVLFCRGFRISVLPLADIIAPAVALGHAFGRVGCFFGGCCYGVHVSAAHPMAVRFPDFNAGGAPPGVPLLPVQLIEAACLLLISAVLSVLYMRFSRFRRPGQFGDEQFGEFGDSPQMRSPQTHGQFEFGDCPQITRIAQAPGFVTCMYGLMYSVLRFVLEYYRGDLVRGVYGLFSTSQYVSIVIFCISAAGLAALGRQAKTGRA